MKNKDEKTDTLSRASLGPDDDPRQDGAFIIDALNGKVFVKFEGKLRHILALPTFEGVFKRNEIHLFTMRQENMALQYILDWIWGHNGAQY